MKVVDSSGWIQYFTKGPFADSYEPILRQPLQVLTPTIILYEVYKKLKKELSEQHALEAVAQMAKTEIAPLTDSIALEAADISLEHKLPMADALIYSTARHYHSDLYTSDSDFKDLPHVVCYL
jgi:toxin FitB